MKFESNFGVGEIVFTRQTIRGDRIRQDVIGEVIAVTFVKGSPREANVSVRLSDGSLQVFLPEELIGDPQFNQETGSYPERE